jgi:hypothetical protein
MSISRDPNLYLQRRGIIKTDVAGPVFDPAGLLIHNYPIERSECAAAKADGEEDSPDRAKLIPWTSSSE